MAFGYSVYQALKGGRRSHAGKKASKVRSTKRGGQFFTPGRDRTSGFYGFADRELKFLDGSQTYTTATAGTISPTLLIIPQGTTQSMRIGRRCNIHHVDLMIQLKLPPSTDNAAADDLVRIILYCDKQCNGTAATAAQLLVAPPAGSVGYRSHYNLSNVMRFKILYDKTHKLVAHAGGISSTPAEAYTGDLKLVHVKKRVNLPIEYNGTAGLIGEIRSNNIGLLVLSESAKVTLTMNTRIRFSG